MLENSEASRKLHEYLLNQQKKKEEHWMRKYGRVLQQAPPSIANPYSAGSGYDTKPIAVAASNAPSAAIQRKRGAPPVFVAQGPIPNFLNRAAQAPQFQTSSAMPATLPPIKYHPNPRPKEPMDDPKSGYVEASTTLPPIAREGQMQQDQSAEPLRQYLQESPSAGSTGAQAMIPPHHNPRGAFLSRNLEQHTSAKASSPKPVRDIQAEGEVLRAIKAREDTLERLKAATEKLDSVYGGGARRALPPTDPTVRLFYRLVGTLRSRTLDAVEALAAWKRRSASAHPFVYYGSDYLAAMGPDLAFLDKLTFLKMRLIHTTAAADPFLTEITPDGIPVEEVMAVDLRRGHMRFSSEALRIRMARKVLAAHAAQNQIRQSHAVENKEVGNDLVALLMPLQNNYQMTAEVRTPSPARSPVSASSPVIRASARTSMQALSPEVGRSVEGLGQEPTEADEAREDERQVLEDSNVDASLEELPAAKQEDAVDLDAEAEAEEKVVDGAAAAEEELAVEALEEAQEEELGLESKAADADAYISRKEDSGIKTTSGKDFEHGVALVAEGASQDMQEQVSQMETSVDAETSEYDNILGAIISSLEEPYLSTFPSYAFTLEGWEAENQGLQTEVAAAAADRPASQMLNRQMSSTEDIAALVSQLASSIVEHVLAANIAGADSAPAVTRADSRVRTPSRPGTAQVVSRLVHSIISHVVSENSALEPESGFGGSKVASRPPSTLPASLSQARQASMSQARQPSMSQARQPSMSQARQASLSREILASVMAEPGTRPSTAAVISRLAHTIIANVLSSSGEVLEMNDAMPVAADIRPCTALVVSELAQSIINAVIAENSDPITEESAADDMRPSTAAIVSKLAKDIITAVQMANTADPVMNVQVLSIGGRPLTSQVVTELAHHIVDSCDRMPQTAPADLTSENARAAQVMFSQSLISRGRSAPNTASIVAKLAEDIMASVLANYSEYQVPGSAVSSMSQYDMPAPTYQNDGGHIAEMLVIKTRPPTATQFDPLPPGYSRSESSQSLAGVSGGVDRWAPSRPGSQVSDGAGAPTSAVPQLRSTTSLIVSRLAADIVASVLARPSTAQNTSSVPMAARASMMEELSESIQAAVDLASVSLQEAGLIVSRPASRSKMNSGARTAGSKPPSSGPGHTNMLNFSSFREPSLQKTASSTNRGLASAPGSMKLSRPSTAALVSQLAERIVASVVAMQSSGSSRNLAANTSMFLERIAEEGAISASMDLTQSQDGMELGTPTVGGGTQAEGADVRASLASISFGQQEAGNGELTIAERDEEVDQIVGSLDDVDSLLVAALVTSIFDHIVAVDSSDERPMELTGGLQDELLPEEMSDRNLPTADPSSTMPEEQELGEEATEGDNVGRAGAAVLESTEPQPLQEEASENLISQELEIVELNAEESMEEQVREEGPVSHAQDLVAAEALGEQGEVEGQQVEQENEEERLMDEMTAIQEDEQGTSEEVPQQDEQEQGNVDPNEQVNTEEELELLEPGTPGGNDRATARGLPDEQEDMELSQPSGNQPEEEVQSPALAIPALPLEVISSPIQGSLSSRSNRERVQSAKSARGNTP